MKIELSMEESAEFLNISNQEMLKLLRSGEMPFRILGDNRRILWIDLELYKEKIKKLENTGV